MIQGIYFCEYTYLGRRAFIILTDIFIYLC